jgi:RNA 2',3'-cyclic 3'-phosphodiesterase
MTVRLFFAFWPADPVRAALAAAAAAVSPGGTARPVARANFHLTVAFLGAVPEASLESVRGIGAALQGVSCTLRFDAYEYWPKPEVVVAAARTIPPQLQAMWEELHGRLAAQGFQLHAKRLRPHVTLVRHVAADPALPLFTPFEWAARELCLVASQTGGNESVYTVVDTWSLLDKPATI